MLVLTQLLMRPTAIVGRAAQIHARMQRRYPLGCMTALAGKRSFALAHRGIEAFNTGGVKHAASLREVQPCMSLIQHAMSHVPSDLDHAVLGRVFDDRADVQLWPHL